MAESKKVGSSYQVYDHVLNLTRKFKKKADADDFALSLANPPASSNEGTTQESNQTTNGQD